MSPSDKNKSSANTKSKEAECSKFHTMDSQLESDTSSKTDVTKPGLGKVANIPLVTASQTTLKCSINDQMKTFDPGEDGGIERLTNVHCGSTMFPVKNNNKNYKAGSKINKLADMLAKRSQNVVEVTQNNTSDIISGITSEPKVENTLILNNVNKVMKFENSLNSPVVYLKKTANGKELDTLTKNRRKSVPNENYSLHQVQLQSGSKSCLDFTKLFSVEENNKVELNDLGPSLNKLQTDESTKTKAIRKNLKNVELSLILPEKKRRSSMRTENLVTSKIIENIVDNCKEAVEPNEGKQKILECPKEIAPSLLPSSMHSVSSTKIRKESKMKQRKSKRLVETSTQTADIEFISMIKSKPDVAGENPATKDTAKPIVTYECLYCTQTFALGSQCKAHEKTHSPKNIKQFKCQYCCKKFSSLDELKCHCLKKHPNKNSDCLKCNEKFTTKEQLNAHCKKIHVSKNEDVIEEICIDEEESTAVQEKKRDEPEEKQNEKKISRQNGTKSDLKIDVSYDSSKKSSVSPRNIQKTSPKEPRAEEQLLEMEMLFYSHLSGNIQENLTNHLDGKLDKRGNPVRTDQIKETSEGIPNKANKSNNLLSAVAPSTGAPDIQISRAPSPYQTRSKTPNPLPPTAKKFKKLPNWQQKFWEKYNFPTNYRYEHRFWDKNYLNTEKSAFYLKDLSCLDIKTQLTMRENIKKLDNLKLAEENSKPVDKLKFPDYLSLVPRLVHESSQDSNADTQKSNLSDLPKYKKQIRKEREEAKKSFKSPGPELPFVKTRRKLSLDNCSSTKKQTEKVNSEGLKMITRRQSSIDLMKADKEDSARKRKGSLDISGCERMALRRQTSLDNIQGSNKSKTEKNDPILKPNLNNLDEETESTSLSPAGSAEISGEWVRPRSYLCGTCCAKFTNLWELEDHKWVNHPNVWCTHYEFEDEKIDKLFQKSEDDGKEVGPGHVLVQSNLKLTDLYKRYLLPNGSLKTAKLVPHTTFPEQCTKCNKNCMNSSEMHKHMLDCGGDTTWFLTMYSSPMTIKRKWRPFGSRRRKQIGRRDLKRNIPSTPTLRSYHYQHRIRTKPGDVESIQKMLANLPEKRTRRAINFDDIKTRSQATIHSNRLLRKRFKTSFTTNFLNLKNMRQNRQLKQVRKEGSSKSTTDSSSESTPVGSPKRKNKLRDVVTAKQENLKEASTEGSTNKEGKSTKKKFFNKNKETAGSPTLQKNEKTKLNKRKTKTEEQEVKPKPITRSNTFVSTVLLTKSTRNATIVKEESVKNNASGVSENITSAIIDSRKQKESARAGKKNKKVNSKAVETKDETAITNADVSRSVIETNKNKFKKTLKTLGKKKIKVKEEGASPSTVSSLLHRNKKHDLHVIQSNRILRLKQNRKDKTEILKRIKKKLKNSKRILELKEAKRVDCASRRSQRIKSLQMSEELSESPSGVKESEVKPEEHESFPRDIKLKKAIVSLEDTRLKGLMRNINEKCSKGNVANEWTKESSEGIMRPDRRVCSRLLRNSISLEEKPETRSGTICEKVDHNIKKFPVLRGNSKASTETVEPIKPNVENVKKHKKAYRIQNVRILRRESPHSLMNSSGQISLLKKNRIQTTPIVKIGETSEIKNVMQTYKINSELSETPSHKNNDLSEMPILAKVEPIHGKINGKNESEIPVLMPFEREAVEEHQNNQQSEETRNREKGLVSFQVIKNKRKTSKEVTPLKIVKKVENAPSESEKSPTDVFSVKEVNSSAISDILEVDKNRKRKNPVICLEKRIDLEEKRTKNSDVKKYFLGICPNEIDKGGKDGSCDSGSDSEPLISLVVNQKESSNSLSEPNVKEEDFRKEVESQEILLSTEKKLTKSKKKKKIKKKKVTKDVPELADSAVVTSTVDKKIDDVSLIQENVQAEELDSVKVIKTGNKKMDKNKKISKKPVKGIRMTVTLKEPTLKILDKSPSVPTESKWTVKVPEEKSDTLNTTPDPPVKEETSGDTSKEKVVPERRSRRISREIKSSSEFIIDDPLILVDELWSDLDSDSDCSKKKNKKGKKKPFKKKNSDEKRVSDVKLEELLRNFGENKDSENSQKNQQYPEPLPTRVVFKTCAKIFRNVSDIRKRIENRKEDKSNKRLSLKLFRFNKTYINFGNRGERLSVVKRAFKEKQDEIQARAGSLLDLPFLAAEIKENPMQVIQCRAQKSKAPKKGHKKEPKNYNKINFKISLPLESINNMTIFNNNHLTELVIEESSRQVTVVEETSQNNVEKEVTGYPAISPRKENQTSQEVVEVEASEFKNKSKRSDVIDKIFYCEICKTYYYSSSQLKIHKLSNRHKLKEFELAREESVGVDKIQTENESDSQESKNNPVVATESSIETVSVEPSKVVSTEPERQNEDTLEMPTLEGPFIENPLNHTETLEPSPPVPPVNNFTFSQESLKDIQRAIGCTDEEMLILTLLGENTIEIENDILDLDSCKSESEKGGSCMAEKTDGSVDDKANGSFKVDLKQRMTSALACLVNKAVFNLLQKYESTTKTAVNPEALTFLGKLSSLSRRKNILQLNELLKKQNDGESSVTTLSKDLEKKEPTVPYKYQCTICGSRFEKASTRECHISRSHRGKAKKSIDDPQVVQTITEDDWNDSWSYDANDDLLGNANSSQFWCSDCGINFLSPQEVLEHQKKEHQACLKDTEQTTDTSPLQSSTIGSSDEIVDGKKTRRRTKLFSTEELDQQRIIANNELRKLDRKFSSKNKTGKIKWGMDALKFTVEKENKMVVVENEKEVNLEDRQKAQLDVKNIDLVPKLNLSRTSNIPEFKVIQKTSFRNRFQKIIDNKLKRKITSNSQQEAGVVDMETDVMVLPVVVKKKIKKQKPSKYVPKRDEIEKVTDVYDFNESEPEEEPMVFSHVKKTLPPPPKLKLVKVKEGPSKNKADSTTKDLTPDDYDSEDSLPLSIVKMSKPVVEEDKTSEDGAEKSEGILEQVEYLIEQLENETGSVKKQKDDDSGNEKKDDVMLKNKNILYVKENKTEADSLQSVQETFRVSVANKFLQLENISSKNQETLQSNNDISDTHTVSQIIENIVEPEESILVEPESSQSIFDEEDSMPLVLMSKKIDLPKANENEKKFNENTTDFSTTASEDVRLFRTDEHKNNDVTGSSGDSQCLIKEDLLPLFNFSENEIKADDKMEKSFEALNDNVVCSQNESLSDFGSESSNDGLIHSNYEKPDLKKADENFIEEITEKEDVVIVCSRREEGEVNKSKLNRKRLKSVQGKKKRRFPLLTATIDENNFRKSESPKLNKEVIVRKIWSRRKLAEDSTDNEGFFTSFGNENSTKNIQNDEFQTEIEKEIIVKKIWSRKKLDHEGELIDKSEEKFDDIKINQTEISDEVVIKCGPKPKTSPKRRKSRTSTNESSKETIMRKIWSGKCFQTKAALKNYDSDMTSNCKENNISEEQVRPKKRGRPAGFSAKRSKAEVEVDKDDEDDLDSLLEEIEREQLEKAIRLEFLHLRRSEKGNVETLKDGTSSTVGLFAETNLQHKKKISDRKRKKVRKKIKHPKQSLLKRRKFLKKPIRRLLNTEERSFSDCTNRTNPDPDTEESEKCVEKNNDSFVVESKIIKNRKHKKHRHKHHHHKHKHKKSKHHKYVVNKHKSKHKFEEDEMLENTESFTILEKICRDIPNQIVNEWEYKSKGYKKRMCSGVNDLNSKSVDNAITHFSYDENEAKGCDDMSLNLTRKGCLESGNVYDFVEDIPETATNSKEKSQDY